MSDIEPAQSAENDRVPRMAVHRLLTQFRRCADHLAHADEYPDPAAAAEFWIDYIDQWEQEQKEHLFDPEGAT